MLGHIKLSVASLNSYIGNEGLMAKGRTKVVDGIRSVDQSSYWGLTKGRRGSAG